MNVLETNTNLKAVRLTNQVCIDFCLTLDSHLQFLVAISKSFCGNSWTKLLKSNRNHDQFCCSTKKLDSH